MSLETEVLRLNVVHRRPAKQPRLAPTCDFSLSLWLFHLTVTLPRTLASKICGTHREHTVAPIYCALRRFSNLFPLSLSAGISVLFVPRYVIQRSFGSVFRYPPTLRVHSSFLVTKLEFFFARVPDFWNRTILSPENCVSSSFQSLVIFDRSRAALLLILSVHFFFFF